MKSASKPAGLRRHLNVYPSGRNLRLTFDYLSREIGEPGVRKGRLLAQVEAKF